MANEQKPVPVDPKKPERPIDLIVVARNYLLAEMDRFHALASDAAGCKTAYAGGVLVSELATQIATYRSRGLQALSHIVDELFKQYGGAADGEAKAD